MKGWETREGRQTGGEQEDVKLKKKDKEVGERNVIHTHTKKKKITISIFVTPKSGLPDRERKRYNVTMEMIQK